MTVPEEQRRQGARKSRQILWAFATGAGAIAVPTLFIEIASDRWLAEAIGIPVFISTPLGLAATALSALALKNDLARGLVPSALALVYWVAFLLYW